MIEKLIFWEHAVETLGYFSRQMAEYFRERGRQIFFVDHRCPEESLRQARVFAEADRTVFVTFNFIGLSGEACCCEADGRSIWEAWGIPCCCILVDHPLYYYKQLHSRLFNLTTFCVDRGHVAYMRRFYPDISCHFLPLAGNCLLREGTWGGLEEAIPYTERSYDIAFLANYVPLEELEAHIADQPEEYVEFYREIIEELKRNPARPVDEVLEQYIRREVPGASPEDICSSQNGMMVIDLYIRSVYRAAVLRSLTDAGLTVHVFGKDWDRLACACSGRLLCNDRMLTSGECVEIIRNSKIALNVMPWFKDGAHDRIFTAMLNGAVSLTDGSGYLREILTEEEVCFYELPGPDKGTGIQDVAKKAKLLLENPDCAEERIRRAYAKAADHTWGKRAAYLEEIWKGNIDE